LPKILADGPAAAVCISPLQFVSLSHFGYSFCCFSKNSMVLSLYFSSDGNIMDLNNKVRAAASWHNAAYQNQRLAMAAAGQLRHVVAFWKPAGPV
jgi:hypothetical protein